jgi:hypothetical protein
MKVEEGNWWDSQNFSISFKALWEVRMRFLVYGITALLLNTHGAFTAEMDSENFRIHTSIQSGGGIPIDSANYHMNNTIGQPSPLMDPSDPPYSDNYDLYPGIWYTVAATALACPGDFNGDKDVDGSDLAEYLFYSGRLGLEGFALNFGKEVCP